MRRIAPAVALYFLAPFVAEFLLGDFPLTLIFLILPLSTMYGGGALFVRELVRRTGRGWPTIVLLAVAFGVVEEGLLTQSLFNPDYLNAHLLDHGFVPALGISIPWTVFVVSIHTIFSISAPIALVEESTRTRRTTPWLRTPGFIAAIALFLAGCAMTFAFSYNDDEGRHFLAHPTQLATVVLVAALLVSAAFLLPRRSGSSIGTAPSAWTVFGIAMAAGLLFFSGLILPLWAGVTLVLAVLATLVVLTLRWSARAGWGLWHRFALAAAALLSYAWHSFFQLPVTGSQATLNLVTHIVFTAVALFILWYAQRRVRAESPSPGRAEPEVSAASATGGPRA
jgi:hypothetical protein